MPEVESRFVDGQWRVVFAGTDTPATRKDTGAFLDSGGHGVDVAKAQRQANHVNSALPKKTTEDAPKPGLMRW